MSDNEVVYNPVAPLPISGGKEATPHPRPSSMDVVTTIIPCSNGKVHDVVIANGHSSKYGTNEQHFISKKDRETAGELVAVVHGMTGNTDANGAYHAAMKTTQGICEGFSQHGGGSLLTRLLNSLNSAKDRVLGLRKTPAYSDAKSSVAMIGVTPDKKGMVALSVGTAAVFRISIVDRQTKVVQLTQSNIAYPVSEKIVMSTVADLEHVHEYPKQNLAAAVNPKGRSDSFLLVSDVRVLGKSPDEQVRLLRSMLAQSRDKAGFMQGLNLLRAEKGASFAYVDCNEGARSRQAAKKAVQRSINVASGQVHTMAVELGALAYLLSTVSTTMTAWLIGDPNPLLLVPVITAFGVYLGSRIPKIR